MIAKTLRVLTGGFLMGSADLVPGVSGGTIALMLGIYERLVSSIRSASSALGSLLRANLNGFRQHAREVEWSFILLLLGGIGFAIVALSSFLERQLEERPIVLAAAFFGLVLGSVVVAWRLIRQPTASIAIVAGSTAIMFFLILGFRSESDLIDPALVGFFGAGALAICAMILPGISGSLILVLIGMYQPVLDAVNDRTMSSLGAFALGAIVGLALFSQVLHWALENHHDPVLAALVGLMAGSLRILWPWPDGVDSGTLGSPDENILGAVIAAAVGFGFVWLITRFVETRSV